jgi:hypothetical protein
LTDAQSVADVLRWRVRHHTDNREPEQQVDPADWTTLAAPVDGPIGQFLHELAVLASDRQAALGHAAATEQPTWATSQLGPPPDDPGARQAWVRAAGIAGAYRELRNLPDDMPSIGPAPAHEQEFHRALWRRAAAALGLPTDTTDYHSAPDAVLHELVRRWEREQTWAPDHVADNLKAAHAPEQARRDAVLGTAQLATMNTRAPGRAELAAQVTDAAQVAKQAAAQAHDLEQTYTERGAWSHATAEVPHAARLAAEELTRRGIPIHSPTHHRPDAGLPSSQQGDLGRAERSGRAPRHGADGKAAGVHGQTLHSLAKARVHRREALLPHGRQITTPALKAELERRAETAAAVEAERQRRDRSRGGNAETVYHHGIEQHAGTDMEDSAGIDL